MPGLDGPTGPTGPTGAPGGGVIFATSGQVSASQAHFISSAPQTVQTIDFTAPTAGSVLLTASAAFAALSGTQPNGQLTAVISVDGQEVHRTLWDAGDIDGFTDQSQSQTALTYVTAGPHTFTLVLSESSGQPNIRVVSTLEEIIVQFAPSAIGPTGATGPTGPIGPTGLPG